VGLGMVDIAKNVQSGWAEVRFVEILIDGRVRYSAHYDDPRAGGDGASEQVTIRTLYRLACLSSEMKVASSSIACAMSR